MAVLDTEEMPFPFQLEIIRRRQPPEIREIWEGFIRDWRELCADREDASQEAPREVSE